MNEIQSRHCGMSSCPAPPPGPVLGVPRLTNPGLGCQGCPIPTSGTRHRGGGGASWRDTGGMGGRDAE